LKKFNNKFGRTVNSVSEDVQKIFMEYPWQGNVRELEHAMEHAFILCHGRILTADQLPSNFRDFFRDKSVPEKKTTLGGPEAILEALKKSAGNKALAARLLGISRRTLYRKLEEYEIK
jgi:transcriptional regulator with PAS, ATPase and Fis domain